VIFCHLELGFLFPPVGLKPVPVVLALQQPMTVLYRAVVPF